jgi:hypothetical protein
MSAPETFAALEGKRVTVWHATQSGPPEQAILEKYPHKPTILLPGGGTVGLRAMVLAHAAGFRELHLYGMDSSYRDGAHHAYAQSLNDGEPVYQVKIEATGKEYRCAGWMARQADEFQRFRLDLIRLGAKIWCHGEGLIPDLSRMLNKKVQNGRSKNLQGARGPVPHRPEMGRQGQPVCIERGGPRHLRQGA